MYASKAQLDKNSLLLNLVYAVRVTADIRESVNMKDYWDFECEKVEIGNTKNESTPGFRTVPLLFFYESICYRMSKTIIHVFQL